MSNPLAGAVLADPPWPFKTRSPKGEGRSACRHYRGRMTIDEIKAYPVADMVAADAWLFLWVPTPLTPMTSDVMAAWEFIFSGLAFSWPKRTPRDNGWHMGLGHTTRKNIELCWLGRRGKPKRLSRSVRELIVAPRREHSRKPDERYERIEQFCAGPYLELFARQRWPGWMSIGDEVDHFSALERVS